MEAKDVKSLSWRKVTDWSELSESYIGFLGLRYVCETDVNVFVENVFRDIARKLGIPYEQLKPVLQDENSSFYTLKKRLFAAYPGLDKMSTCLIELEDTLRVPDIIGVKNVVSDDNVSNCLKMFEELSNIEKMVFLQKIGKINVKIEYFAVQEEESAVD